MWFGGHRFPVDHLSLRGGEAESGVEAVALDPLDVAPDHEHRCVNLSRPILSTLNEVTTDSTATTTVRNDQADDFHAEARFQYFGRPGFQPTNHPFLDDRHQYDSL